MDRQLIANLKGRPRSFLVTGGAGFIGSHLVEYLLKAGQLVVTVDNLSTGSEANLGAVAQAVGAELWQRHKFINGDISDFDVCLEACENIDVILHQAALGSVPRSLEDPVATNEANVTGFLNVLEASRLRGISRFIYAASSSTYGDSKTLPKIENDIGNPLSPYAVTKYVNELYANVYHRQYGIQAIGLRYFNVFGPRQDPNGAYAAVIPKWIDQLLNGSRCVINGKGDTSRDFCFVANAVQANLRAALVQDEKAFGQVFNVACSERTSLLDLHEELMALAVELGGVAKQSPIFLDYRKGDVLHSLANINKAQDVLGYGNLIAVKDGLRKTVEWHLSSHTA